MARVNNGVIGQRQELPVQAEQHLLRARAREVEPADLARQQGVAGKDVVTHLEGEAARCMSRRDQHLELEGAERQPIARDQVPVRRLQLRGGVRQMHRGRGLGCGLHRLLCAGVASMRVGEHDPPDGQPAQLREDFRRVVTGVDDHRLLRVGAGHHVAIGVLFADVDFLDG